MTGIGAHSDRPPALIRHIVNTQRGRTFVVLSAYPTLREVCRQSLLLHIQPHPTRLPHRSSTPTTWPHHLTILHPLNHHPFRHSYFGIIPFHRRMEHLHIDPLRPLDTQYPFALGASRIYRFRFLAGIYMRAHRAQGASAFSLHFDSTINGKAVSHLGLPVQVRHHAVPMKASLKNQPNAYVPNQCS